MKRRRHSVLCKARADCGKRAHVREVLYIAAMSFVQKRRQDDGSGIYTLRVYFENQHRVPRTPRTANCVIALLREALRVNKDSGKNTLATTKKACSRPCEHRGENPVPETRTDVTLYKIPQTRRRIKIPSTGDVELFWGIVILIDRL
jgi:hypothetical protein